MSLCLEFCVPEVGGTGTITKVRFYLTSSTCKRKLNSEHLCSYSWKFNYYFSRVGSIIPGGGSIKTDLSGGGTTSQAAFLQTESLLCLESPRETRAPERGGRPREKKSHSSQRAHAAGFEGMRGFFGESLAFPHKY